MAQSLERTRGIKIPESHPDPSRRPSGPRVPRIPAGSLGIVYPLERAIPDAGARQIRNQDTARKAQGVSKRGGAETPQVQTSRSLTDEQPTPPVPRSRTGLGLTGGYGRKEQIHSNRPSGPRNKKALRSLANSVPTARSRQSCLFLPQTKAKRRNQGRLPPAKLCVIRTTCSRHATVTAKRPPFWEGRSLPW